MKRKGIKDPLLFFTTISCLLCFIPLISDLEYVGITHIYKNDSAENISNSSMVISVLVAAVAISVPMFIEVILNFFMSVNKFHWGMFPYISLVFALLIPDLLILVIAIPFESMRLLLCLSSSRYIIIAYGIFGHLWHSKLPIFQSKLIFICLILLDVSFISVTFAFLSFRGIG